MSNESKPLLAMVALNTGARPDGAAIVGELRRACPQYSIDDSDVTADDEALVIPLGENQAVVAFMPAPIPWEDLEGPCVVAWWWDEATERMEAHQSHTIVALIGEEGSVVERSIQLSHTVAAVAAVGDTAGIYWGAGSVVHEPQMFQALAKELRPDDLAPQLWIDMRLGQNDDGSLLFFTHGMGVLGHPEVEIDRVTRGPEELLDFCNSIINYILTSGATIEQGQTIGRSEDEKITISYGPSMWDRPETVMKLNFE